ncbi:hypothetical protein BCR36DRAFT_374581 [Piromyces finnis]|uniref:Uncharacterized protein n=1 Tax=Piromyces finnis TaxID=1754191 RepID=A0A1Y1UXS3_9FUNG|nr:hypothetical protein BCR36DRAFT_374581 [Piromyces finnis]|eukprot:ORX42344.1 hypothetical protein BCR36DRAFT_374581 [Piromyces finnis]
MPLFREKDKVSLPNVISKLGGSNKDFRVETPEETEKPRHLTNLNIDIDDDPLAKLTNADNLYISLSSTYKISNKNQKKKNTRKRILSETLDYMEMFDYKESIENISEPDENDHQLIELTETDDESDHQLIELTETDDESDHQLIELTETDDGDD